MDRSFSGENIPANEKSGELTMGPREREILNTDNEESNMEAQRAWEREIFGTDDMDEIEAIRHEDEMLIWREENNPLPEEKWTEMSFPYYAPDLSLPPLPTPEEIEIAAMDRQDLAIGYDSGVKVRRMKGVYCVKFSWQKPPWLFQEAENLLFLQQHGIRAPKLYAAFSHQGADPSGMTLTNKRHRPRSRADLPEYRYVIMEWIDGIEAEENEVRMLDLTARLKICRKIGEQLKALRSIPAPSPRFYGRVNGQPFQPQFFLTACRGQDFGGPFYTFEGMRDCMLENMKTTALRRNWGSGREALSYMQRVMSARFLDRLGKDSAAWEPKLTHHDIEWQNMVFVSPSGNSEDKLEDRDVVLIDWEHLTWVPAFMEPACLLDFSAWALDACASAIEGFSQEIQPFFRHEGNTWNGLKLMLTTKHFGMPQCLWDASFVWYDEATAAWLESRVQLPSVSLPRKLKSKASEDQTETRDD